MYILGAVTKALIHFKLYSVRIEVSEMSVDSIASFGGKLNAKNTQIRSGRERRR
jgi:hypothetical protein